MSDQEKKTNYADTFKKAVTSKPVICVGGGLAFYYSLLAIVVGTNLVLTGDNMPQDFVKELDKKAYVHKISDNECYFVDPNLEKEMTFLEYPSGYLSGMFRLFTPFVETDSVYHDMGSMPVLSQAPCDVLKDDKIVTKGKAVELMNQWKKDLKNGEKARKAFERMESGKGFFGSHYVRKAAPKP